MAVAQGPSLALLLLLVPSLLLVSSHLPACPESCTCQRAPLLNCSSAGLSLMPQHIQNSVTELDLSHNLLGSVTLDRPHYNLRNSGSRYVRGRHLQRLRPWRGRGCVSWAPTLQLLSVERNQLEQLPQGLGGCGSLQVLQLSFNRISTLRPADLNHLQQLKELHLRHNLISSLHPQMFQDLAQLRVLDLSFNMLTSLHPLIHLSLHSIGADVRLDGNRWHCDCRMRSLRRRMAYDSSIGLQNWSMMCASPPILSGKNLLQLEEDDLNCVGTENRPELHQDVTVYSGSEILLSCATQDSIWLTPSGQASVSQPHHLVINDITEKNTGLYVCVSDEVVSVFNLQISKMGGARRKTRSLSRTSRQIIEQGTGNRISQERNLRATQSNLALAVCLSVFITFLIAFILGVLSRPCIDMLWSRVTKKKTSSATNSVSSVEQRQYDNEAYSNGEEQEQMQTHRERRVTFSTIDVREEGNVKYYDTVAGGNQERINDEAVIECEAAVAEKDAAEDSGSENSLQRRSSEDNQRDDGDLDVEGHLQNMEFEPIPEPVELEKRKSLSSCSDSSLSDKELNERKMIQENHSTPKASQLSEDSVQQRGDFSTAKNEEGPHISTESTIESPGFSSEPFADWSPHTHYTNPSELWQENEEQFEFSDSVRSTSARSSSVSGSFNDSKRIVVPTSNEQKRDDMSSSSSNVSEDEPTHYTVNSDKEEKKRERIHNKPEVNKARLKPDASFDEADPNRPSLNLNQGDNRFDKQWPTLRPQGSFSSHSSDSDGEDYTVKKGRVPSLSVTSHGKSLDTGAPLPPEAYSSSSSSESEAGTTNQQKQRVTHVTRPQIKESQTERHDSDTQQQWPVLDLKYATTIKSRLDIKAPSPASSSSSDSEDETTHHTERPGKVDITGSAFQESQTVSHDPEKSIKHY
ncbi:hypothetical protein F7725_027692 [Dissostichus mawsoni]|uniref:Ig-like domain-containing protein n=1 Tax=Dissostichus mawsoni TaxID=36200 RepID=A0A7J5XDR9_DISMA|nr:hypothetical protein F7725_027692 [Dissostichus mawsoni]